MRLEFAYLAVDPRPHAGGEVVYAGIVACDAGDAGSAVDLPMWNAAQPCRVTLSEDRTRLAVYLGNYTAATPVLAPDASGWAVIANWPHQSRGYRYTHVRVLEDEGGRWT